MKHGCIQQQTCKICGQPDKLDFTVPDDIWRPSCLIDSMLGSSASTGFDEKAREHNVDYAASLSTLYFAGRGAAFEFRVVRASSLRGG